MIILILLLALIIPLNTFGITITTPGGSGTTETLTSLGIPNHDQLDVSASGIVTLNNTINLTTIKAKTSAGVEVLCLNGSRAALFDGGGSCSITTQALSATANVITPVVKASSSAGLKLQDDGANTGLLVNDGGKLSINTTSTQGQVNVSGDVCVTGNVYQYGYKQPLVIACSGVPVSHTGAASQVTLATVTVPGGLMGANGRLRIYTLWSFNNDASAKTARVKIGATEYSAIPCASNAHLSLLTLIANTNNVAAQVGGSATGIGIGLSTAAIVTGTADTSANFDVTITGALSDAGDTITLLSYTVEVIR